MTTTLNPSDQHVVLINTFTVDPAKAEALLAILSKATREVMRDMPGFVSANLHLSQDRKHLANYAQWRSQDDLDSMMRNPAAREHMAEAAKLATSFEPILYELIEAH